MDENQLDGHSHRRSPSNGSTQAAAAGCSQVEPRRETVLTVGILADLDREIGGGVNEFTRGLVRALLARPPDEIRYVLFVADDFDDGVIPSHERAISVRVPRVTFPKGWLRWAERVTRYGTAAFQLGTGQRLNAQVTLGKRARRRHIAQAIQHSPWHLDLVHFPFQDAVPLDVPTIFTPWDLQHRHLPQFWTRFQARTRDAYLRLACRDATCVVLASEWALRDVLNQYQVPKSKTALIRVAPPAQNGDRVNEGLLAGVRHKHALPERFMYFPGATWKHKNHDRLLAAFAQALRDSGDMLADLHLVCSGQDRRRLGELMELVRRLGLRTRVHFLGYVEQLEVCALYRLAQFCIFPSLFEGAGLPVLEAFALGCPLAASHVTCIPEYAGDAALLFDPWSTESIAEAIVRMASGDGFRRELVARGEVRSANFSWIRAAEEYVALYHRVAGHARAAAPVRALA